MESLETILTTRRDLLSRGTAAGVMTMLMPSEASSAVDGHPEFSARSVRDFGAIGDAVSDDTAAFQRALDAVGTAGGGTVYAPRADISSRERSTFRAA